MQNVYSMHCLANDKYACSANSSFYYTYVDSYFSVDLRISTVNYMCNLSGIYNLKLHNLKLKLHNMY